MVGHWVTIWTSSVVAFPKAVTCVKAPDGHHGNYSMVTIGQLKWTLFWQLTRTLVFRIHLLALYFLSSHHHNSGNCSYSVRWIQSLTDSDCPADSSTFKKGEMTMKRWKLCEEAYCRFKYIYLHAPTLAALVLLIYVSAEKCACIGLKGRKGH